VSKGALDPRRPRDRQKNKQLPGFQPHVPAYTFNGNFTSESIADLLTGNVYQFDSNTQAVVEQTTENRWHGSYPRTTETGTQSHRSTLGLPL